MRNRPQLVLLRHGESMYVPPFKTLSFANTNYYRWNPPKGKKTSQKGWRYAGAMDVPLSEDGISEAIQAGRRLKSLPFDVVYCSMLIRAQMTALIALASHDSEQTPLIVRDNPDPKAPRGLRREHLSKLPNRSAMAAATANANGEEEMETNVIVPVYCSHSLNERDFGDLQGMHSKVQRRLYTPQELEEWRCSWDKKFPGETGESSAQVSQRVIAFYQRHIQPKLEQGKNVMVVAHGFVQRVLIKHLVGMTDSEWVEHMKLESHAEVEKRKSSKLLAQNAVPVIFSFTKDSVVRVVNLADDFQEKFAEEEEGMYHKSAKL